MGELLLCEEVRIVGCVDTLSRAKDAVCCRKAAPQLGAVLNIIDPDPIRSAFLKQVPMNLDLQERRVMEHSYDSINDVEGSLINLQPYIEGSQYLRAKILAGQRHHVVKRPGNCLYCWSV